MEATEVKEEASSKRRRVKQRKPVSSVDHDKISLGLATATDMCNKFDFWEALNLLNRLEIRAKQAGDQVKLERCVLKQAEIYIRMGNQKNALRCLLKCPFSRDSVKLIAKLALANEASNRNIESIRMAANLLKICISTESSDDHVPSDCRLLLLDCLCNLGKASDITEYISDLPENFIKTCQHDSRYLHIVLSKLRSLWNVTTSMHQHWLKVTSRPSSTQLPYITLFRNRPLIPDMQNQADSICQIITTAQQAFTTGRTLRLGDCSLYDTLLNYFKLLNDMDLYDQSLDDQVIKVNFDISPIERRNHEGADTIVNVVKTRTKRNSKRRINFYELENGSALGTPLNGSQPIYNRRHLRTKYLGLNRNWSLSWKSISSQCMDEAVRHKLFDVLRQKPAWSMREIAMVMFEVICQHQHLIIGLHERYTLCVCHLLYFLSEMLSDQNSANILSSGCLYLSDNVKEARLLNSKSFTSIRLRRTWKSYGSTLLCLILDTLKSTPVLLRDISSPLMLNDPQEFLKYMFKHLSSVLLMDCATNRRMSSEKIIRRGRILFIMAKYIIWTSFPKKGKVIFQKHVSQYNAVYDIAKCLHSLLTLGHSTVLYESSRNIHLRLAIRYQCRRLNFHSSLTRGSFGLGLKCIERRYQHLCDILSSYQLKA